MPDNPKYRGPERASRQQARYAPGRGTSSAEVIDLVEPLWIFKAVAGVFAVALLCVYITICTFFFYTQWQLVLHPSRTVAATPTSVGLGFSEVHFDVDATGSPQIDGWFIPADTSNAPTALLLHAGEGSMSNALPDALTLHDAHLNVLLFDYRGYGRSAGRHPTEASMQADADKALSYLTTTRSIPISSVVVYGSGVGGSLAVHLCARHRDIPALILQSPDGDFKSRVEQDARFELVPVALLFNQRFPLADPLHTLTRPKLLLSSGAAPVDFQRAANPKVIVDLQRKDAAALQQSLNGFLTTYLH